MQSIPQISVDAKLLCEMLEGCAVGDVVTYDDINAALGRKDKAPPYGIISTAKRRMLNDKQMVFASVAKVGLKRLSDVEIVDTGEYTVRLVRRATKRAAHKITAVNFDNLPNDKKVQHNVMLSMFGALSSVTSSGNMKKLENKVRESQAQLPLAKTLDAFK